MPLTRSNLISDLRLGHAVRLDFFYYVRPFDVHDRYYRYCATFVKRNSDSMDTLAERLKKARSLRKINQALLAKHAGLKNQSIIGSLESGHRKTSSYIPEIAEALGVNSVWLATGRGAMQPVSDSSEIAELWSKLPPEEKAVLLPLIRLRASMSAQPQPALQHRHLTGATGALARNIDEGAGMAGVPHLQIKQAAEA